MTIETRGRPLKLNDGMITALSDVIAKGNYAVTACQLCNIDEATLWLWGKQGKADIDAGRETIYSKLVLSLKRAEAKAEAKLVQVVRESAEVKRDWIPAMTMLERRHPDRWGRKDRLAVDVKKEERIQITQVTVTRPEIIEGEVIEQLTEGQDVIKQREE